MLFLSGVGNDAGDRIMIDDQIILLGTIREPFPSDTN